MHNLWIPVVAILAVAGLIFGGQAYSEAQRDAHIAATIAEHLDTEISHLARVRGVRRLYTCQRRVQPLLLQQRHQAPGVRHRYPAVSRQLRGHL